MTEPMAGDNDLIERYVREVGRHLPRSRRADVLAELRELLRDQIDDAAEERPLADRDGITAEVLRAMGPPDRVARGYAPATDVWIGPELYPTFRNTAWIVLVVYSALSGLWALGIFRGDVAIVPFRFDFDASRNWMDIMLGAVANVGIVTLIFGIVERMSRGREAESQSWDPHALPALEDADRISRAGQVLRLTFTAIFALMFNFAPEWLGLFMIRGDGWGTFPVLAPEYRVHLPWLNAFWAAAFVLHLSILWQGRWRTWSRAADLALGLFGAAILYRIATGGPFTFLDVALKPVIVIAMIATLVASAVRAVRLVRRALDRGLEPAPAPVSGPPRRG